ncbi:peptide chain release factor N(5)-glutamine methyltransferase [Candidatus Nitronereus thalassa]|uniref:Release factor glutamine methyltransferase n=1 Tax=Candidatus Nitronereus thalassa TaxID=3020898 RepID=A0ABU3KAF7_9BACT|nr:peptide chain release factor N(5)-glutamine methyltransferase [Candidatus Nitronereus thalassa]MDT7043421.1 peptide chain release factor N(5)-glutamine methyltransferase [Candidatus Nitronereus thalassa]
MTYASAFREGVACLSTAGVANAANETVWLLEATLGISRLDIHVKPHTLLNDSSWTEATHVLSRRAEGEPLQYILGTQEFRGLDMSVRPGGLIPRPETELILDEVHSLPLNRDHLQIADIGTGSGCLAVALAKEIPGAMIYATDCSEVALELAKHNASRHKVQDRITFLHGDLLEPFNAMPERAAEISVLVANPPYIPTGQLDCLPSEVRDYEPHLALDGGSDGLMFYRRLLREALLMLPPGGWLVLEFGEGQASSICEDVKHLSTWNIRNIRPDNAGIERVISLERKG